MSTGNVIRGIVLVGMLGCSVLARAEATQSGSPPKLDPGPEASDSTRENQNDAWTNEAVKASAAQNPKASAAAEQQDAPSRSGFQRFNDGEGAPK